MHLILASQSPRRHNLLKALGFTFEVRTRPIDEHFPDDMPPHDVAEFLAVQKAEAVTDWLEADTVILTADTTVICENKVYNKPQDREDALRMLREISGRWHEVVTGVCLKSQTKTVRFSAQAEVFIESLTEKELAYYVDTFKPYDKAGSYATQEWIGLAKISQIKGTHATIMGLPTDRVYKALTNW